MRRVIALLCVWAMPVLGWAPVDPHRMPDPPATLLQVAQMYVVRRPIVIAAIAAPDWASSFVAVYKMNDGALTTDSGPNNYTMGTFGGPTVSTTVKIEGSGAGQFTSSNGMNLAHSAGPLLNQTGDVTYGGWVHRSDNDTNYVLYSQNIGYVRNYALFSTPNPRCYIVDSGGNKDALSTVILGTSEWRWSACRASMSLTNLDVFVDGVKDGAGTTIAGTGLAGGTNDILGIPRDEHTGASGLDGYVDEIFVHGGALTDAALCRICACGVDGLLCTCDGTAFATTGRRVTSCGSCSLSGLSCNAATPPTL